MERQVAVTLFLTLEPRVRRELPLGVTGDTDKKWPPSVVDGLPALQDGRPFEAVRAGQA